MYALAFIATSLAAPLPIQGGAGLFFNAGGTFQAQPLENEVDGFIVPGQGWGGYGSGGGLALEGRFFDAVGLELDIVYRQDVARSTFSIEGGPEAPFQISQGAWHVPLLLKVVSPVGVVRPNLFGGGEFIFPGTPTITQPDGFDIELAAHSDAYKAWAFGFGFEFVPPGVPFDLRIPLSFRGAYNTGVGNSAADRADYTINGGLIEAIDYRSVWQWHAAVTLGATVFFP